MNLDGIIHATKHFAGFQQREFNSGLDPTPNRMYHSRLFRWMTPDEFTGGPVSAYGPPDPTPPGPLPYADILNPQSLNKYQYAYGNPLRYVDPTGRTCWKAIFGGSCADDPGPPPSLDSPPKAPPITLTCVGKATFSDVSKSQMNRLLTKGPGGALKPSIVPSSGTVAIGGPKTFGLSYRQLRQFGSYITVNPTDLSGTIANQGGPSPPYTVSDVGDVNIQNAPGTRYDIYAFPDKTAMTFGVQTSNATVTVIPAVQGAHCPCGSQLVEGPPQ